MKRFIFSFLFIVLAVGALPAQQVSSPDESLEVALQLKQGHLFYSVTYQGEVVIEASPLGLKTDLDDFGAGLSLLESSQRVIDEAYALPHGKVSQVHYQAHEMATTYSSEAGRRMTVLFRVSNRDVAFAYRIEGKEGEQRIEVLGEHTGFDLPLDSTATVTPQVAWGEGFARSKPSYEEAYSVDVPVTTQSTGGLGFTFPALFHVKSRFWVLVSETGVSSQYAGTRLSDPDDQGLYRIAFPESAENNGIGSPTVFGTLPLDTPWRTLTIGESLAPIIESTVATDVVEPQYEPAYAFKPGRSAWSWLLWQDASMNWDDQMTFIDLAAEMGYEYILVDAWWDARIGRDRIAELVNHARSKGVEVILWYNSNGYWNDAFQTPRNCMDRAPVRQAEMAWLQSIGVKGLKVDFFGGDKQASMKLYEDILTDANRFGLHINFHGTTLPRGWERMYPNHMTSEAITASENLVFSQDFADREAENSTLFPFVRNPVAAMDYGPVLLNKRFARNNDEGGNVRRTTDAFQLATAVLYQSPIQHFGITPLTLETQPDYVIDFLKQVPAAWDELRFVGGYPGKYIFLARRKGDAWYLAGTHAASEAKSYTLSLPWLKNKTVSVLYDQSDREAGYKSVQVDSEGHLTLTLQPFGGVVVTTDVIGGDQ